MGVGGSLPNNVKSQEPPPLPPPFYTGNPQPGISMISGISCESQPDGRLSGTSTLTLGNPGLQHPRSSEEWWHHQPSAPSLSGLRPQQETLLTYAGHMTGWQSSRESTMPSVHQEAMELSRTVSHLAAANQQLATAHTTLLAQLEALYLDLNRERELRLERERDERRRRITSSASEYENEKKKLSNCVADLEATISDRSIDRDAPVSKDKKPRASHDEAPRTSPTKDIGVQSESFNDPLEFRLRSSSIDANNSKRFSQRERLGIVSNNRPPSRENNREYDGKFEDNDLLSIEYKKAVDRIQSLENELAISNASVDLSCENETTEYTSSSRRNEDNRFVRENNNIEGRTRSVVQSFNYTKHCQELLHEIERLRIDRQEYHARNEKLVRNLENEAMLMDNLKKECEIFRSKNDEIEFTLNEQKTRYEVLIMNYEDLKLENTRLSKELQIFNFERDTVNLRIADLEKELANSVRDKELLSKSGNQEILRLKQMLSDETTSGKKQAKALEIALIEIQRLNELIENSGKTEEAAGEQVETTETESSPEEEISDPEISVARSSNMEEFRKELSLKREARQRAIAAVSSEMDRLRRELDAEKEAHSETSKVLDLLKSGQTTNVATNHELVHDDVSIVANDDSHDKNDWQTIMKPNPDLDSNEADAQALTDILKVSDELKLSIRLQTEKIDDLRYHLECEAEGHKNRIASLKDIAKTSRETSGVRERQVNKLKNLLAQILTRLGDQRFRVDITDDVRSEHDRQIEDIRRLKGLYDDRLRILVDLRDSAFKELKDLRDKLKYSRKENLGLEDDLKKAEEKIDTQDTEISNLESQLGLTKADCRDLQNQMSVINGLFTQMLLSASSADMDLDRLTRLLQENHDLISDMAREEGTEAAALPKLLLDIVEQVEGRSAGKSSDGESDKKEDDPQEENIAHNLPKVWRVLLELLSCHAAGSSPVTPASLSTDPNSCYKSVDTPSGPRLVISVSKTYIRLKELILEKKHLEKEMNRMKTLNTHLESKLGEQEKRLSTVSSELNKTWNIVGRMQAQHQQLHTHEKILRYELQQKRKMLQELKQELEYCREKWESARQKNTNTEIEWRSLRREFAARKSLVAQDSFNNSAESGFSDERGDDSDEEDETVGERVRIGPRRRARKDNARAPTPDTESEQPTDTELSEAKTTPETNGSTEDVSTAGTSTNPTGELANEESDVLHQSISLTEIGECEKPAKSINSLDQALTNVIQNLITVDHSTDNQLSLSSIASSATEDVDNVPSTLDKLEIEDKSVFHEANDCSEDKKVRSNETNDASQLESNIKIENLLVIEAAPSSAIVSVFSIGPFPSSSPSASAKCVQFSDPLVVGPSIQSALPVFGDLPEASHLSEITKIEDFGKNAKTMGSPIEEHKTTQEQGDVRVENSSCNLDESTDIRDEALPETVPRSTEPSAAPLLCTDHASLQSSAQPTRSHEDVLAARAARLRRLEEQADWLMKKMNATSKRSSALCTRLEELHEVYGDAPVPPPMPDVLPNVRIPLEMTIEQKDKDNTKSSKESPPPDLP